MNPVCLTSESITTRLQWFFLHMCMHVAASLTLPEVLLSPTAYMDYTYLHGLRRLCFLLGFAAQKTVPGRGPHMVRQVEMEMCPCLTCPDCRMKK